MALRPFLNFAVAAFVFLSGYLTPRERAADAGAFLRRRIGKIAAPYVVWTVLYLVARGALAPLAVLAAFIVGAGSAQLYYLVVYLQPTLLTPWLLRLLDRPAARTALYAVTPLALLARYALSVAGFSLPIQAFCGSWLLFYLLGLEWRARIAPWLRARGVGARHALVAMAACLVLCRSLRASSGWRSATTTWPPRSSRRRACSHRRAPAPPSPSLPAPSDGALRLACHSSA